MEVVWGEADRGLGVEEYVCPHGKLVLDARWFPVLVTGSVGEVEHAGVVALCDWMDRMVEEACARDVTLVTITSTAGTKRPRKEDVRYIMARADARTERAPGRVIAGLVVVEGAVMRGIVALALWLGKQPIRMTTVASMSEAVGRARQLLEQAGVAVPPDLDDVSTMGLGSLTKVS